MSFAGPNPAHELSAETMVALSSVVCSVVCFIGTMFGMFIMYLINKYNLKQSPSQLHSTYQDHVQLGVSVYEDVTPQPDKHSQQQIVEMKDNVAYGPI